MSDLVLPPGTLSRHRRPRVGYALTITAATLFAVNGSVSKIALDASDIGTLRWTELRSAGGFVGLLIVVAALKHLPVTTVGIVATFEPVVAAVVAWVWLGETLAAVQIAGGAVVLVGILLAETSR